LRMKQRYRKAEWLSIAAPSSKGQGINEPQGGYRYSDRSLTP
jgi:hypothetical protein